MEEDKEKAQDSDYLGYEPVIEGLVESDLNVSEGSSPWAGKEIIPAEEIAGLLYGQRILVECIKQHYKSKHLGWAPKRYENGKRLSKDVIPTEQPSKVCKVSGLGRGAFGMSLFIHPSGSVKNPFALHLIEYGRTWAAFKVEDE